MRHSSTERALERMDLGCYTLDADASDGTQLQGLMREEIVVEFPGFSAAEIATKRDISISAW